MANKITIEMLNEVRAEVELKPVANLSQRMINIMYKETVASISVTNVKVRCSGAGMTSISSGVNNSESGCM